jgi:hypothetical protein
MQRISQVVFHRHVKVVLYACGVITIHNGAIKHRTAIGYCVCKKQKGEGVLVWGPHGRHQSGGGGVCERCWWCVQEKVMGRGIRKRRQGGVYGQGGGGVGGREVVYRPIIMKAMVVLEFEGVRVWSQPTF